jgi:hypothetical protein
MGNGRSRLGGTSWAIGNGLWEGKAQMEEGRWKMEDGRLEQAPISKLQILNKNE